MLLFMHLVLSGMANSVDLLKEQSDLSLHCLCHFVRNFGVHNFRIFTVCVRNVAVFVWLKKKILSGITCMEKQK